MTRGQGEEEKWPKTTHVPHTHLEKERSVEVEGHLQKEHREQKKKKTL